MSLTRDGNIENVSCGSIKDASILQNFECLFPHCTWAYPHLYRVNARHPEQWMIDSGAVWQTLWPPEDEERSLTTLNVSWARCSSVQARCSSVHFVPTRKHACTVVQAMVTNIHINSVLALLKVESQRTRWNCTTHALKQAHAGVTLPQLWAVWVFYSWFC